MNRDQKATAIAEIAGHIDESEAIFAVDYRGITVAQIAELRVRLRDADATFKVVKNSLTERAADQAGAEQLKEYLVGPTALTFVRGDAALAAKAVAEYARATQLLPFKGGLMSGDTIDAEQIRALSRLPARDVLYGQLVGVVASPVSGLVRTLSALLGGLASALGQVREKKESGEIPAGEAPAGAAEAEAAAPEAAAAAPEAEAEAAGPEAEAGAVPAAEAGTEAEAAVETSAPEAEAAAPEADAEAAAETEPAAEADTEAGAEAQAAEPEPATEPDEAAEPDAEASTSEPEAGAEKAQQAQEPAQEDENQADVSAEPQPEDAETSPKED